MARRRKSDLIALLGLRPFQVRLKSIRASKNSILALGILITFGALIHFLKNGGGSVLSGSAGLILGSVGIILAVIGLSSLVTYLQRKEVENNIFRTAILTTEAKISALSRRRAQLVQPDAYGKAKFDRWQKEIDYFIQTQVEPSLTYQERSLLPAVYDNVKFEIEKRVVTKINREQVFQEFSNDMTPAEFEVFCAEQLRHAGWNASVTMQSRDQGVDVIAEKNGVRVVIQCKLYKRPVGNKSVQEAAAARAHEDADFGVVVTNNRYTSAAEQLASTNEIALLHYRDLPNLDNLLTLRSDGSIR